MLLVMLLCVGCEWHMKTNADYSSYAISVERYDLLQQKYISTGDFSAMRQMNVDYPVQTNILIEELLAIGKVDEPDINGRLLAFYQDSTLQQIVAEVGRQYSSLDDISKQLSAAFMRLKANIPEIRIPMVYSMIGALNQSVVIGDGFIGICLDKYLGSDYGLYAGYYPERQRQSMQRAMIVPDCIAFYLLSVYPHYESDSLGCTRDMHKGKIQWVVNKVMKSKVFDNRQVASVDEYMKANKGVTFDELLSGEASIAQ